MTTATKSIPLDKLPAVTASLLPEKTSILLGEPIALTFTIANPSDQDLQVLVGGDYRNALGRPESFKVRVTGENGQPVSQPKAGIGAGGMIAPQKLPAHGHYDFKLFLPHWATFERPGTYTLAVARTLSLSPAGAGEWMLLRGQTMLKVQANATLRVLPSDNAKMGELIALYGNRMLHETATPTFYAPGMEASRYLGAIHDARTIPYFARLFELRGYETKVLALQALASYREDAALDVLKRGVAVTGADMESTTAPKVRDELASNVRQFAAIALANSPHPRAYPFLLTQLHDPASGVRLTVLHAAAKHQPASLATVQALLKDHDATVRAEAQRYLKEFATKR